MNCLISNTIKLILLGGLPLQEAFRAFHPNMKLVSKYMPSMEIGKLASGMPTKDEEIKKDFEELKRKAEELVCARYIVIYLIICICS
jgi:hypothetical protein